MTKIRCFFVNSKYLIDFCIKYNEVISYICFPQILLFMKSVIGKRIRYLRKSKGITQEQMADLIGISQSAYSRIEKGESHSWSIHLEKIASILETKVENIIITNEIN